MTTFRQALESTLKALPPRHRAAFAAACAERLIPGYLAFHQLSRFGDPALLLRALDRVWSVLEAAPAKGKGKGEPETSTLAMLRAQVEAVIPQPGEFFLDFTSSAVEAGLATRSALICLERGEVRDALEAARSAEDTVRLYLQDRGGKFSRVSGEEPHPLMAEEHRAQRWTLQKLTSTDVVDRALVRTLREAFRGHSSIGLGSGRLGG